MCMKNVLEFYCWIIDMLIGDVDNLLLNFVEVVSKLILCDMFECNEEEDEFDVV